MKTFKKIAQGFKAVFEGNRCRFADECKNYQEVSACCNKYNIRFSPIEGKIYCGKYRSMEEDEEKEIKQC